MNTPLPLFFKWERGSILFKSENQKWKWSSFFSQNISRGFEEGGFYSQEGGNDVNHTLIVTRTVRTVKRDEPMQIPINIVDSDGEQELQGYYISSTLIFSTKLKEARRTIFVKIWFLLRANDDVLFTRWRQHWYPIFTKMLLRANDDVLSPRWSQRWYPIWTKMLTMMSYHPAGASTDILCWQKC